MSLINHLENAKAAKRKAAWARYRILLEGADNCSPSDAAEVTELAEFLGRSSDQISRDVSAVAEHKRLSDLVAQRESAQAEGEKAAKEHTEFNEKAAAEITKLNAQGARLGAERLMQEGHAMTCGQAVGQLYTLVKMNPELLGQ